MQDRVTCLHLCRPANNPSPTGSLDFVKNPTAKRGMNWTFWIPLGQVSKCPDSTDSTFIPSFSIVSEVLRKDNLRLNYISWSMLVRRLHRLLAWSGSGEHRCNLGLTKRNQIMRILWWMILSILLGFPEMFIGSRLMIVGFSNICIGSWIIICIPVELSNLFIGSRIFIS